MIKLEQGDCIADEVCALLHLQDGRPNPSRREHLCLVCKNMFGFWSATSDVDEIIFRN